MLKIAIVGCGRIADAHAAQIARIDGCEIVAACDREELMARQFAERFGAGCCYVDLEELLRDCGPDVVHITTPPQSHYDLGMMCLEHGAHIYIEKPFTVNAREAEKLIARADELGLKITAGHDDQFRHSARRMRDLIRDGYLGGAPVHMESYYCYELASADYAAALLGDENHWVRTLPGQLMHNVISHGIARIAEFLDTDSPEVLVHGFVSPFLREISDARMEDELRVIIQGDVCTAYFTFSSQMRPCYHRFRIFGPENGLVIDQDNETIIRHPGGRRKSYLEHFVSPLGFARQYVGNVVHNVRRFLARDFHMKAGMKCLIEAFYKSVRGEGSLPISYREILLTARIMDAIFENLAPPPVAGGRVVSGTESSPATR